MSALAGILALASLIGVARTLWWQRRSPLPAKPWRIACLVALQIVSAVLLWRTLEPPLRSANGGTLVVATAGTLRLTTLAAGNALVALPEAPALPGATRVPDLATALRRNPGTTSLRILGTGLPPRDQYATTLPTVFDPAPLPRGIAALSVPPVVAPGAAFRIAGRVQDVPGGSAELRDPAGRVVARASLSATGDFALLAMAGVAGPAVFTLRITDRGRRLVDSAPVPVMAAEARQPRVLVVAGAAGPDLKYLRRWATDAGITIGTSVAAGNGLDIGDAPPRLDAATLARHDLLVLDERSWATVGLAGRAQVLAAVRGGLGLLLRVTGPVPDATRRDWAALGFATDNATRPVRLSGEALPLTAMGMAAAPASAPLLRSASGQPAAQWRNFGRGRVGLLPITDLYAVALAGRGPQHAAIWSGMLATLARADPQSTPRIDADAIPGQRMTLCNLGPTASVRHPDGVESRLIVDAGCAGFWPRLSGWHDLRSSVATQFQVMPPHAGLVAAQARVATRNLAFAGSAAAATGGVRGASWPWLIAWAFAAALLWWFERSGLGRRSQSPQNN